MTATFLNCYTKRRNKQSSIYHLKMSEILFNCYFCFCFTFIVYTNGLNTVVFIGRKRKEKNNLTTNLPGS